LRVLEPGFKKLESREESKTNASDIFHFDIALAEPDKQQSPQSVGDKQRVLWSPVILVGTHHRADAATQLVHEFEQRVEDMLAAGFACTTTCWR
jgi:hypothetical protein